MTVKDRIGTLEGVLTVRVDSRNPKTADGFNTFIFRRPAEESLRLLMAAPIIDAVGNPLPEGIVVGDKSVRYTPEEKKALIRFVVECAKKQYGPVDNPDCGRVDIGRTYLNEIQCHAISTRREIEAVSSSREIAKHMIHFVGAPNEEVKEKHPIKFYEYFLAKVRLSDGVYLVMGELGFRVGRCVYYDQRVVAKIKTDSEATSIQGQTRIGEPEKSKVDSEVTFLHEQSRIGESTFDVVYDNRFRLILQGVAAYFDSCQEGRIRLSQELRLGKLSGEAHGWISQSEIERHFNKEENI